MTEITFELSTRRPKKCIDQNENKVPDRSLKHGLQLFCTYRKKTYTEVIDKN